MNEKKFRRSGIAIACYVVAALLLVYTCFTFVSTLTYLSSMFGQYGTTMGQNMGDTMSYVLSAVMNPLVMAILVFMAGYILEEVRSQNPAYYVSAEELAAAKAEKAAKKEAAKAAKAAKAVEKAEKKAEEAEEVEEAVEDKEAAEE